MRILIYTTEYAPWSGGVATFCETLARGLTVLGDDVAVAAPSYEPDDLSIDSYMPFRVFRAPPRAERSPTYSRFLVHVLCRFVPDVLILANGKAQLHASRLDRLPIPFAVYLHGNEPFVQAANDVNNSRQQELMRLFRNANRILANSNSTARLFRECSPEIAADVHVAHLGIDPDRWKPLTDAEPEQARQLTRTRDNPIALCVARLVPDKGHESLLHAFKEVCREIPNARLHLAGDGPCRADLESLSDQLGIQHNVEFLGDVSPEVLRRHYSLCDIFCMSSRHESFGLVYLEANLFGKPVIAGKTEGAIEAVIDGVTGILVDPIDSSGIARAIIKMIRNPAQAERLGQQGRERVYREFTHVHMSDRIRAFLALVPLRPSSSLRIRLWAARHVALDRLRAVSRRLSGNQHTMARSLDAK